MQYCNLNVINRRSFLDRSLKTGMAAALATLTDIPLVVKRALAEGNIGLNGKKLMFIWMRGANDGLNSVIPILDPAYLASRPLPTPSEPNHIGIPTDAGTDYSLTGPSDFPLAGSAGSTYGTYPFAIRTGNGFAALHPSLKFLAPVYNAGNLALVHRVAYPRQSRSHFDSQRYWENGTPNNNLVNDGILYRTMIESGLANTAPLTGVSIQGSLPLILRGSDAAMTNLTDPLRYDLLGIPNDANGNIKATNALFAANNYPFPPKQNRDLLRLQYQNMSNTLGVFASINFTEAGNIFQDDPDTDGDTDWVPIDGTGASIGDPGRGYFLFPTNSDKNGGWRRPDRSTVFNKYAVPTGLHGFFGQVKAAAMVLNHTDAIIAGTEYGGFDTHQQQGGLTGAHPDLNRGLGWALYALRKYFSIYGKNGTNPSPGAKVSWNDIVIVTLSEFGRTTVENSDLGTDHAEAGVSFLAGGAIKGFVAGTPGNPPVRSGVFNCSPNPIDPAKEIPWVTGPSGAMFGVSGRYLRRTTDYRQILGELIREHLGATEGQLGRILPGYVTAGENLKMGGTSVDGTQIRGELDII